MYRKLGYEGFEVGSYKAYDVWVPADYAPGYRTSNACAATSALAAILGIVTQGLDISKDVQINLADLVTKLFVPPAPVVIPSVVPMAVQHAQRGVMGGADRASTTDDEGL